MQRRLALPLYYCYVVCFYSGWPAYSAVSVSYTHLQVAAGVSLVQVVVLTLAESAVTLRASLWAKDNGTAFSLKCTVQENIKKIYEQEGIEIAYPHVVVVQKGKGSP